MVLKIKDRAIFSKYVNTFTTNRITKSNLVTSFRTPQGMQPKIHSRFPLLAKSNTRENVT